MEEKKEITTQSKRDRKYVEKNDIGRIEIRINNELKRNFFEKINKDKQYDNASHFLITKIKEYLENNN